MNLTEEMEEKRQYLQSYRLQQMRIKRFGEMLLACPEKAGYYRERIDETRRLRDRIEIQIEEVDGDVLSEILLQKYVCGRSLEEISYALNYSKRQTERLHLRALEAFSADRMPGERKTEARGVSPCQIVSGVV